MSNFKIMNDRKRKPFVKVIAVIFGVILLTAGFLLGSAFGVAGGLLLIWSAFFIKYTIVNEEGIIVHYDAKLFRYHEQWRFDEISHIHREAIKDPDYSILHFTKGVMSKRLVFEKNDAHKVIEIALKNNKTIHFDEAF